MNIYEKIQQVKERLLNENIKKSGLNKYAGYNYYELSDFTPYIVRACKEIGLFTSISFNKELATLKIINTEKPEETVEYTSPMEDLELKGCNKVQALGGVETYSRRYLYMTAFDIVENDMFDATTTEENNKINNTKVEALKLAISKYQINEEDVESILNGYSYKNIEEIKVKDFKAICDKLEPLKKKEA